METLITTIQIEDKIIARENESRFLTEKPPDIAGYIKENINIDITGNLVMSLAVSRLTKKPTDINVTIINL